MTQPKISKNRVSRKAASFTESVIREMTREALKYGAVNLSQGFPDFAAPEDIKRVAMQAIEEDYNQYAITWGTKDFRRAIADKTRWFLGLDIDTETEITVTCGSTEGMIAAMMATVDEGEEVIVFEPFYENYAPDAILSDARPRHVPLYQTASGWFFDKEELKNTFNEKTKAIILCNPNNPTGKVFSMEEMQFIADLCREYDALCFTDEIYEHILYDQVEEGEKGRKGEREIKRDAETGRRGDGENLGEGKSEISSEQLAANGEQEIKDQRSKIKVQRPQHISMAQLEGMRERTVIVNSMSKTYSVTGWRVGWCIAPADITGAIRKVHDFLTVGAAHPLQQAGAYALSLPASYYDELQKEYQARRDFIMPALQAAGFKCDYPDGAYYVMTDISEFGFENDVEFTKHLIREIGVAVVPGSSFYHHPDLGRQKVRFCFCKKDETLEAAAERLQKLKSKI